MHRVILFLARDVCELLLQELPRLGAFVVYLLQRTEGWSTFKERLHVRGVPHELRQERAPRHDWLRVPPVSCVVVSCCVSDPVHFKDIIAQVRFEAVDVGIQSAFARSEVETVECW